MLYAAFLVGLFQHCIRTSAEVENLVTAFVYTSKQQHNNSCKSLDGISGESHGLW